MFNDSTVTLAYAPAFSVKSIGECMAKVKPLNMGDLFLIPRSDGLWVLGQVLEQWMTNVICIGIFDHVLSNPFLPDDFFPSTDSPFAMPSVASAEITKGYWPRVGSSGVTANIGEAPHRRYLAENYVGAEWYSGKVIERLVNAFYGFESWDPYSGRPGELKSLLLQSSRG